MAGDNSAEPTNTVGMTSKLGTALITALPAPFLALALINLIFVLALVWYFDHLREDRRAMFLRLMDACIATIEHTRKPQ